MRSVHSERREHLLPGGGVGGGQEDLRGENTVENVYIEGSKLQS